MASHPRQSCTLSCGVPDTVLVAKGFPGTSSLPIGGAKAQVGEV